MEYHKAKDILHVQQLLGHRSIKKTLLYTLPVNLEEDEYVCDQDDFKFFRKRK